MKAKLIFSILILGLFFLGCDKDNVLVAIDEPTAIDPIEETEPGFLYLNATVKEMIRITTGKPPLEDVLSEMNIYIKDNTGFQVYSSKYDISPETIELSPGYYQLLITDSPSFNILPRFDNWKYGYYNGSVNISSGAITTVNANLALLAVASTINISTEVAIAYPDIEVNVRLFQNGDYRGYNGLNWTTVESGRTGYFLTWFGDWFDIRDFLQDANGDLEISISATNNSGAQVSATKTYAGVSANELYQIFIEPSETTGLNLLVTLADEVVIDDIITFPY